MPDLIKYVFVNEHDGIKCYRNRVNRKAGLIVYPDGTEKEVDDLALAWAEGTN